MWKSQKASQRHRHISAQEFADEQDRKKQSGTKATAQRCKDTTVQEASAAPQALNVGLKVDACVLIVGYRVQESATAP